MALTASVVPGTAERLAQVTLRAVLVVIALMFFATGLAILTRPLAVPLTIGLWLCGSIPLGLAAFMRLPAARDIHR